VLSKTSSPVALMEAPRLQIFRVNETATFPSLAGSARSALLRIKSAATPKFRARVLPKLYSGRLTLVKTVNSNRAKDTQDESKNSAALPRRPRGQHPAHGGGQTGARKTREGRDRPGRASSYRRPRNREDHQETEIDRPEIGYRRRVPPVLVALRFLRET